jgi:hypothetical protein
MPTAIVVAVALEVLDAGMVVGRLVSFCSSAGRHPMAASKATLRVMASVLMSSFLHNKLITGAVVGAGFQYPSGVISSANCADAPISDNPISFFIETRFACNKRKTENLQTNPARFSTNAIIFHNRKKSLSIRVVLGLIG